MKKVGNLGNVKFMDKAPKTWPKDKEDMACKEGQLGAYAMYNHLDLFEMYPFPGEYNEALIP